MRPSGTLFLSMNKKDFFTWSAEKEAIHESKPRIPFFNEKDVWFASLGVNVGFEQDGKGRQFLRPIVVLKKFNNETLWGIALTSKSKTGPYYFSFTHDGNRRSTANLSQFRLIDSKRLQYKIGTISSVDFEQLKQLIIDLIG